MLDNVERLLYKEQQANVDVLVMDERSHTHTPIQMV